jgi:hypothetical protein
MFMDMFLNMSYILVVGPFWFAVGFFLWTTRLIAVTQLAQQWWGVLTVFGIPYEQVKERSASLSTADVACRFDQMGSNITLREIQQSAQARQKRVAGGLGLHLPRQDLAFDVALLSKMTFIELFLKYVPQFFLLVLINDSTANWSSLNIASCIFSAASLLLGILSSWRMHCAGAWASNFEDIATTTSYVAQELRSAAKSLNFASTAASSNAVEWEMKSARSLAMQCEEKKQSDALLIEELRASSRAGKTPLRARQRSKLSDITSENRKVNSSTGKKNRALF